MSRSVKLLLYIHVTFKGLKVKIGKLRFRFHLHKTVNNSFKIKYSVQTKINVKHNIDTSFTIHFKKVFFDTVLSILNMELFLVPRLPHFLMQEK